MKLEDIANLLAEKINQAHYILHYLNKIFAKGFELGKKDKENFAIGFAEWIDKYYYQNQNEPNSFTECKEDIHNGKSFTIKQLLEIYKETL